MPISPTSYLLQKMSNNEPSPCTAAPALPQSNTSDSPSWEFNRDLWLPPAYCIDPEQRVIYGRDRNPNAPRYVYLLWIRVYRSGEPTPPLRLWRTYSSHRLANHDAHCWLLSQQQRAGAQTPSFCSDPVYREKHEGRCLRFKTPPELREELRVQYYACTTEEILY